jgi:hypothetical protein
VLEKVTGDETLDHNPPFDNVQQPAEEVKKRLNKKTKKMRLLLLQCRVKWGGGGMGELQPPEPKHVTTLTKPRN